MSNQASPTETAPFHKHEIIKEDGRFLTYYEFAEGPRAEPANAERAAAEESERV